jgi:hypothetical protein
VSHTEAANGAAGTSHTVEGSAELLLTNAWLLKYGLKLELELEPTAVIEH